MFSLATFEHQLVMYVTSDDKAIFATAFDINSVPVVTHEQALAEERTKKLTTATPTLKAPTSTAKKAQANGSAESAAAALQQAQKYTQQLSAIPELKAYGNVLKSSQVVELTESETEYVVTAVKHIFKENIVLQFDITNTLPDTVLEEVTVAATPSEDEELLEEEFVVPITQLKTNEPGTVYVAFRKIGDSPFAVTSFTNILRFTSKEIDPTTGEPDANGYEDEYQVEDLELVGSDYVVPAFSGSFDHVWEQTGANGDEQSEILALSAIKSLAGKSLTLANPQARKLTLPQTLLNKLSRHFHCNHLMAAK
jgi:coatomer protein complex subunit gamma